MYENLGDQRVRNEQGGSGDYWEGYQYARDHVWGPTGNADRTSNDSMTVNYSKGEAAPFQGLRFMDDAPVVGAMILAGEVVRD